MPLVSIPSARSNNCSPARRARPGKRRSMLTGRECRPVAFRGVCPRFGPLVAARVAARPPRRARPGGRRLPLRARRPGAGERAWREGHVPGAAHLDLDRDLSGGARRRRAAPAARMPGASRPPPGGPASATGVRVVAYDEAGEGGAARLWWLLRHFGHDDVAVLDGGLRAWRDARRADPRGVRAAAGRRLRRARRARATRSAPEEIERGGPRLLDARAPRALPRRDRADRPGGRPHPRRAQRAVAERGAGGTLPRPPPSCASSLGDAAVRGLLRLGRDRLHAARGRGAGGRRGAPLPGLLERVVGGRPAGGDRLGASAVGAPARAALAASSRSSGPWRAVLRGTAGTSPPARPAPGRAARTDTAPRSSTQASRDQSSS